MSLWAFQQLSFSLLRNMLCLCAKKLWATMDPPKVAVLPIFSDELFTKHWFCSSPQESHCLVDIIKSSICYIRSFCSTFSQNSIQISWLRNYFLVANLWSWNPNPEKLTLREKERKHKWRWGQENQQ